MNTSRNSPPESWEALAQEPVDDVDLDILARAARLFDEVDPPPADLVERLRFAITLDALEFELATLVRSGELAGVRAAEQTDSVRTLTFNSESLSAMVTISDADAHRVRIDGWLAPASAALVELHRGEQVRQHTADADGRFVFADVEHGLIRFVIRVVADQGHPAIVTPAVQV